MIRPVLTALAAGCVVFALASPVAAQESGGMGAVPPSSLKPGGQMSVTRAWARATAAQAKNGAAYFTLLNTGPADTLTGASTSVADSAELHRTTEQNGVMQMRPVQSVPVPSGKITTFAPGGLHVMLMGLKQQLKPGDTFPLSLTFQKAGDVTVTATVQSAGAMSPTMTRNGGGTQ